MECGWQKLLSELPPRSSRTAFLSVKSKLVKKLGKKEEESGDGTYEAGVAKPEVFMVMLVGGILGQE